MDGLTIVTHHLFCLFDFHSLRGTSCQQRLVRQKKQEVSEEVNIVTDVDFHYAILIYIYT